MGNHSVKQFTDPEAKKLFTKMLLNDIRALERMLDEGMVESGITRIGAEQELCLVDDHFSPKCNNTEILDAIADEHFVPELAKFNIEANLDPYELTGDCFEQLETQLRNLLAKAHRAAEDSDTKIILTGILPTLRKSHLQFDYMTPNPRYRALNDVMLAQKGGDFELNIMGIDELITRHSNILFEACNTSFQVHLQISPEEFAEKYNWAQLIAGPVMAAAANSPLLMGKRLWKETRIGLFQQSVDTRSSTSLKREQEARVAFGKNWLQGSIVDLYRDNVSRFNLLFATEEIEDSLELLDKGEIPKLKALSMHNSTVYRWNRACYGVGGGKPHLRIENRYIPSGPTIIDEIANAAFWLGTMHGMPDECRNLHEKIDFEDARYNFYNAARSGLDSKFKWFDEVLSADKVILNKLLPVARKGLKKAKVNKHSIDMLLGVIKDRVKSNVNGSKWMLNNFTKLAKNSTANEASRNITEALYFNQMSSQPVHNWPNLSLEEEYAKKHFRKAKDIMEKELFVANEEDIVDLAINMMDWKSIRNIPVENAKNEVVGIITAKEIFRYHTLPNDKKPETVKELMSTTFETNTTNATTQEIVDQMAQTRSTCILIVDDKYLVGLITDHDIVQVARYTKIFDK